MALYSLHILTLQIIKEDHLNFANKEIISLYDDFKNQILSLGDKIEVVPKKKYIAFKASSNFIDVLPQKSKIKFWLNIPKGELNDHYNISRDVSEVGLFFILTVNSKHNNLTQKELLWIK